MKHINNTFFCCYFVTLGSPKCAQKLPFNRTRRSYNFQDSIGASKIEYQLFYYIYYYYINRRIIIAVESIEILLEGLFR